jgi:hypothetical protein
MTGSSVAQQIIVGMDTHKDVHVVEAGDGAARQVLHTTAAVARTRRSNPIKSSFESGW